MNPDELEQLDEVIKGAFAKVLANRPNSILCVIVSKQLREAAARHHPCNAARHALAECTAPEPYVAVLTMNTTPHAPCAITPLASHNEDEISAFIQATRDGTDAVDSPGIAWLAMTETPDMQRAIFVALGAHEELAQLDYQIRQHEQARIIH